MPELDTRKERHKPKYSDTDLYWSLTKAIAITFILSGILFEFRSGQESAKTESILRDSQHEAMVWETKEAHRIAKQKAKEAKDYVDAQIKLLKEAK